MVKALVAIPGTNISGEVQFACEGLHCFNTEPIEVVWPYPVTEIQNILVVLNGWFWLVPLECSCHTLHVDDTLEIPSRGLQVIGFE